MYHFYNDCTINYKCCFNITNNNISPTFICLVPIGYVNYPNYIYLNFG